MRFEISDAKLLHGINIRNPEDRSVENLVFYHEVLGSFFFFLMGEKDHLKQ